MFINVKFQVKPILLKPDLYAVPYIGLEDAVS